MKDFFKKRWKYLTTKLSIMITPSPEYRIKTFRIRRITPIIILIIIIGTIFTLGYLYKFYENNYQITSNKLKQYQGIEAKNRKLKNELYALTQETMDLKESLRKLKKHNEEIRGMLDVSKKSEGTKEKDTSDLQLKTIFSYNQNIFQQGVPMGGGEFHLYYHDTQELIARMQENLNIVKKELPLQKNDLDKLEGSVREYNARQAATPTIWPVADRGKGYISSDFGWRIDPVTGKQEYHEGLDIGVWYNTPVMVTADGKITYAGWANGYGWKVKVYHGFGYSTCYAHLNKIKVKNGQKVKRGDIIALTGNSGKSTGPHLHYEVRLNNIPKNPRRYIGR